MAFYLILNFSSPNNFNMSFLFLFFGSQEMWEKSTASYVQVSWCLKTNGFPEGFAAMSLVQQTPVNGASSLIWHTP
jgi:hypothetical protein